MRKLFFAVTTFVVLVAGSAYACPGLDPTEEALAGNLKFGLHGDVTEVSVSMRAGGAFNLRDCGLEGKGLTGYRGDGLVVLVPDLQVHLLRDTPQLLIGTTFEEDTLLLIHDPNGVWHFNDNSEGHNPKVILTSPSRGEYSIYMGTHGFDRFTRPGTITVRVMKN